MVDYNVFGVDYNVCFLNGLFIDFKLVLGLGE